MNKNKSNLLIAEVKYPPIPAPTKWRGSAQHFCHDERKLNLLWLVLPAIELVWNTDWEGNEVTVAINNYWSLDLRAALDGPPIEFMQKFVRLNPASLAITEDWPHDYLQTMWRRAKEANARLCRSLGSNVYNVDFGKRTRFG